MYMHQEPRAFPAPREIAIKFWVYCEIVQIAAFYLLHLRRSGHQIVYLPLGHRKRLPWKVGQYYRTGGLICA